MDRSTTSKPDSFQLEIEPDARYVATARMFAAAVARHFDCEEEQVQDLKVAISEACSNAIKAHRTSANQAPIVIQSHIGDEGLRFDVVDKGPGFTWDSVNAVDFETVTEDPLELLQGGIGLSLIETLFPGVKVTSDPDGGTRLMFEVPIPS